MTSGSKVAIIIVGIVVGLPILACGGCFVAASLLAPSEERMEEIRQEMQAENEEAKRELDAMAEEERNRPQMNAERYAKVQPGMTYDQVVAIVGPPSEEMSRSEIAGIVTVAYKWDAGFGSNAILMFQNGKLVQKNQAGL